MPSDAAQLPAVRPLDTATPLPPSTKGSTSFPAIKIEFNFFIYI